MKKSRFIFWLINICLLLNLVIWSGLALATEAFSDQTYQISYFASDPIQYGLMVFDPVTESRQLITNEIGEYYQFSLDGRYLAFLQNNYDQVQGHSNSLSLWVKDLQTGEERVIESDFDRQGNLDAIFDWLVTGELALIQSLDDNSRKVKIYTPDGNLSWTNLKEDQYISHNTKYILLLDSENAMMKMINVESHNYHVYDRLSLDERFINASLSPNGNYFCYQSGEKIKMFHLKLEENDLTHFIEISLEGDRKLEFGWSPDEKYLIYQDQQELEDENSSQLNVIHIQTGVKIFTVNSKEKLNYSWSGDGKQLVYSQYWEGWNLAIWYPDQHNSVVVQSGLGTQPVPVYHPLTHTFIYQDVRNHWPRVYSYDVDQNVLSVIFKGPMWVVWSNINWVPVIPQKQFQPKNVLYWAGWSEVNDIQYLFLLDQNSGKEYHSLLKWAPTHRTLLFKKDEQTVALIDESRNSHIVYSGSKIGEPFWNEDGSYISFVDLCADKGEKELILYHIFKKQTGKYLLEGERLEEIQWMNEKIWFFDGNVKSYGVMNNEWKIIDEWKDNWLSLPRVERSSQSDESLWQIGGNLWLRTGDEKYKVITRLSEHSADGWKMTWNGFGRWSVDDQKIIYNRHLSRKNLDGFEEKWEIGMVNKTDFTSQYLSDGKDPQWLDHFRFIFLKDGNLHLANLVTSQIIGFNTPILTELAFLISYDGTMIAVIAEDQEKRVGLYFYNIK
ncbi:MAG: hypothetical protein KAX49_19120 [Halanaerobiales bacterium]|nr:hypothetical protein [Halanaerobiales bacterium]